MNKEILLVSDSQYRRTLKRFYTGRKFSIYQKFMIWLYRASEEIKYEQRRQEQLLEQNLYGLVLCEGRPIVCGCGGSMFLCSKHAIEMIRIWYVIP